MCVGQEEGHVMAGVGLLGANSVLKWDINEHNQEDLTKRGSISKPIRTFLVTDQCQIVQEYKSS